MEGLVEFHIFLMAYKLVWWLCEIFLESVEQKSDVGWNGSYLVTYFNEILLQKNDEFPGSTALLQLPIFMGQT